MYKNLFHYTFFFFSFTIVTACSSLSAITQPTQIANITSTNSATINPNPFSTITIPVVTEALVTPISISITPDIKIIAPDAREVKLSDLGLNVSTRLILYYEPSDSLRIMSGQDANPQKIPINSKSINSHGIVISPNQKWFAYDAFKEKRDGVAYNDIWISSIDGKEQRIVIYDVQQPTRTRWATNEKLELWYYPYVRQCPYRELVVDLFTQEILNQPKLPSLSEPDCFFELITNPERSKMLYRSADDITWNMYDFNTGESQPVFPWLSQKDSFNLWSRYVQWLPSGITLILPYQDSIDFILDLSPSSVTDVNRQWNKILLPTPNSILWNIPAWVSLDTGLIGFDMIDYEFDLLSADENTPISKFVILDLHTSILYNYDFDRARTGDIQRVSDTFIYASADQRFLAWTVYRPPGMGSAIETVVLERITGKIARIKGFQFLGWGEVDEP